MNSNGVVIHSNRLVNNGVQSQNLQNGSSVLVRVASYKGNGVYEGFVAGVKVNITSQKQLQIGQSFPAKIFVKDGIIQLKSDILDSSKAQIVFSNSKNEVITQLLNNLGISADAVTTRILHQMKQLEMKFDSKLINKVKNAALKFKGKELKVSELLLLLEEKEINFSEEELLNLLAQIEDYSQQNKNQNKKENFKELNKFNEKKQNWIFLPFEFVSYNDNLLGNGILKLLLGLNSKIIEMVNIEAVYKNHEYNFSLLFENKKCSKIYFNIPEMKYNKIDIFIDMLKSKIGKNVQIEYKEKEELSGTSCLTEEFYSLHGEV